MTPLYEFTVSFIRVALMGFQSKNIIKDHYKTAWAVSLLMTACEIGIVRTLVFSGWAALPTVGLGGAFGIVFSMWFHNHVFRSR